MLVRRNLARYWLLWVLSITGIFALVLGSAPARAAAYDSGPVVTLQFQTHLRFRPFWLNYNPPKSRYYATLDACVDPLFVTIPSRYHDFGNCFIMQPAKPGYVPISMPADNAYIRLHDITYWARPVQVIMPDQFAHTLDLTTEYVFHDRGQTAPSGGPLILSHSVVLTNEITISASDGSAVVSMDGSIPPQQSVHFVFHPVGHYDPNTTFWGCLRRPTQGVPSAYCAQLGKLSNKTFQVDAVLPAAPKTAPSFSPDVDPLVEGTNIQMTIVAAPAGQSFLTPSQRRHNLPDIPQIKLSRPKSSRPQAPHLIARSLQRWSMPIRRWNALPPSTMIPWASHISLPHW